MLKTNYILYKLICFGNQCKKCPLNKIGCVNAYPDVNCAWLEPFMQYMATCKKFEFNRVFETLQKQYCFPIDDPAVKLNSKELNRLFLKVK